MPITATFASWVLIFSNNVAIRSLLVRSEILTTGVLVRKLAIQDPAWILVEQSLHDSVAHALAQPLDAGGGAARVRRRMDVRGGRVGQAFFDQPAGSGALRAAMGAVERAEVHQQRTLPAQRLEAAKITVPEG